MRKAQTVKEPPSNIKKWRGLILWCDKIEWVMKMLERAKNLRNNLQIVDLEGMVPQDHLLRKIDRVVDFSHI